MFKGLGTMMKDLQQIQGRAAEMQERLGALRVDGRSGGEMVVVQVDGLQRVLSIKVDPSLLESPDAEMLEELLLSATNQALDRSREAAGQEMSKMTSNLQLPGLAEMMSKLGLGGPDSPST